MSSIGITSIARPAAAHETPHSSPAVDVTAVTGPAAKTPRETGPAHCADPAHLPESASTVGLVPSGGLHPAVAERAVSTRVMLDAELKQPSLHAAEERSRAAGKEDGLPKELVEVAGGVVAAVTGVTAAFSVGPVAALASPVAGVLGVAPAVGGVLGGVLSFGPAAVAGLPAAAVSAIPGALGALPASASALVAGAESALADLFGL